MKASDRAILPVSTSLAMTCIKTNIIDVLLKTRILMRKPLKTKVLHPKETKE
jgi:hypothetical protein